MQPCSKVISAFFFCASFLPNSNGLTHGLRIPYSAVFSGGAGGARAPPEFGGSEKGQSLISAYQILAITMNTPGFKKLNTALPYEGINQRHLKCLGQMW